MKKIFYKKNYYSSISFILRPSPNLNQLNVKTKYIFECIDKKFS